MFYTLMSYGAYGVYAMTTACFLLFVWALLKYFHSSPARMSMLNGSANAQSDLAPISAGNVTSLARYKLNKQRRGSYKGALYLQKRGGGDAA